MIALDTNVLVRFIVEDDEAQTRQVTALMTSAVAAGDPLFVSEVVLCEVVWVLTRTFRLPKGEVIRTLRLLLQAGELHIAERSRVRQAVEAHASGQGDFADYLIRELATDAGCDRVATFDKALLTEPGFFSP